ncbi:hypothetical protein LCGC14_2822020, partial [marine sediment metagenome]
MKGNAKVQTMGDKLFVYLPKQIVRLENIRAGNIIDYEIHNPYPDKIIEPRQGLNFHKNNEAKVKEEVAGEAPGVEIDIDEAENLARVSVSDTGIGIEEDQIETIFDKYYRANTNEHAEQGLGLG